jgi:hypothetical protein
MPHWKFQETKQHVRRRHDETQVELVRKPLNSIVERLSYARCHFQEYERQLAANIDAKLDAASIYEISLALLQPQSERAPSLLCAAANIVACLQSMHALGDILAHVVYFAAGMNLGERAMREEDVTLRSVTQQLVVPCPSLAAMLTDIQQHADFVYLSALVNHCKHRSIIDSVLFVSDAAQGRPPYTLQFDAFTYRGTCYLRREITPYLEEAYSWLARTIDDCGAELNRAISEP